MSKIMNKKIGLAVIAVLGLAMAAVMLISLTFSTTTVVANDFPPIEKTDRFTVMQTENGLSLISQDGSLIIHIGDNTVILFEDGLNARDCLMDNQTLASLLDNRNLTIYYSITTRSIPAQTTPEKIVILYEIATTLPIDVNSNAPMGIVPPIYEFSPGELESHFSCNR